ncbi:MAG: hypothetical protein LBL62_02870 [Planctomycetaceae bacterium]|nr:hypothetical protein [Planctomycetaceae bacterium]
MLGFTIFSGILLKQHSTGYTQAVLKFAKLNAVAQQREAVTRGRSLLPYRLRYRISRNDISCER